MEKKEIEEKYNKVGELLKNSLNKVESVAVVGEEENAELNTIKSTLQEINDKFSEEIDELEKSSEWDKFCIAFFGETNAGKSTIIESLRIIYDEEKRRSEKENQEKIYEATLEEHCQEFKSLLSILQETNALLDSKKEPSRLFKILKNIALVVFGICLGFIIAYFGF